MSMHGQEVRERITGRVIHQILDGYIGCIHITGLDCLLVLDKGLLG
jgi:hypothetical protein